MLKAQLDILEKILGATSAVVNNAGHNIHKGTPREMFIRDFLRLHLTENVGIGTGEVIDHASVPGEERPQLDIVLYHTGFPKLDFGAGINAFLCESVIAHLEVKSTVNKAALLQAVKATRKIKGLQRHVAHTHLPNIYSYVVGYRGPASMDQIYTWLAEIHVEEQIELPELSPAIGLRVQTPSPSLDVVVILGLGFFYYDTSPIGILPGHLRDQNPAIKWVWIDDPSGNLLFLFLHLTQIVGAALAFPIHLLPYLHGVNINHVRWGTGALPA